MIQGASLDCHFSKKKKELICTDLITDFSSVI